MEPPCPFCPSIPEPPGFAKHAAPWRLQIFRLPDEVLKSVPDKMKITATYQNASRRPDENHAPPTGILIFKVVYGNNEPARTNAAATITGAYPKFPARSCRLP